MKLEKIFTEKNELPSILQNRREMKKFKFIDKTDYSKVEKLSKKLKKIQVLIKECKELGVDIKINPSCTSIPFDIKFELVYE